MEQANGIFNKYYNLFDSQLAKVPAAQQFQSKTGVPKVYGAAGVAGVGLLLVFFNLGAALLVNLVGFGYAAYASMCAIESPGKEDDAQWLTYWTVFGLCNVLEYFTGFLLYWFPFYYVIKLGFLIWLMLPNTRGAERLYYSGIKPIVLHSRNSAQQAKSTAAPSTDDGDKKAN
ncbi:ER membrane protein DP1/Yop1 [Coemansia sp. RSA 1290]|nr:ER membrane protein DP1/Yop1 [Coemansia sp. RSA 1290]KAJ2651620.1 ER membrane protein DP1/Yop1 [Coemansia sp. RSA 1250]